MNAIQRSIGPAALLVAGWLGAGLPAPVVAEPPSKATLASQDNGIEVQARGPIHEGFAQVTDAKPGPGPVVPKKPPQPIKEVPPDARPKGKNVQWLPGYWAWDMDRKDFLWVSGVWRVPPRGRRWVPGHWTKMDKGWQWAHGLWAKGRKSKLEYLPAPPESVEEGPSSPYREDEFYVPGCWLWRDHDWSWRPGYWRDFRAGLVWNPSCYYWTPNGYVFVGGYWDYPLEERGLVCAPVFFSQPLWTNPAWFYRPRYFIGWPGLLASLFVRPGWGWYYFGDWYGADYAGWGFLPWYAWGARHRDPFFVYGRWSHRGDPGWSRGLRRDFQARQAGTLARPARTLAAQAALLSRTNLPRSLNRNALRLVTPISVAGNTGLSRVSSAQLARHNAAAQRFAQTGAARINGKKGQFLTLPRSGYPNRVGRKGTTGMYRGRNRYAPYSRRTPSTSRPSRATYGSYRGTPTYSRPSYYRAPSYSRPAPAYRAPPAPRGGGRRR